MLIVAAVLFVLENDNNYKCCQSENCSKKYMVRAIVFWVWLTGSQFSFLSFRNTQILTLLYPFHDPVSTEPKSLLQKLSFILLIFSFTFCSGDILPEIQDLKIRKIRGKKKNFSRISVSLFFPLSTLLRLRTNLHTINVIH